MRIVALAVLLAPAVAAADDVNVDVDVDVKVRPTVTVVESPVIEVVAPPVIAPPMMVLAQPPPRRASLLGSQHWEFGLVGEAGRFKQGDDEGGQVGLRAEIGRQIGPFRLGVEGSVAHIDENGGGELARGAINLRVRAISMGAPTRREPFPRESAWFLESGVGVSRIAWPSGTPAERIDVMLGTGLEVAGGADSIRGFHLGLRLHIAESQTLNTHDIGVLVGIGGWYGT